MQKELRFLMLEDTPTDAQLIEHELRKAGITFTAQRVETREAFIKALDEFHPDIILSDYKLPNFDGMAALQLVRRDHPEVPIIMVTGALTDVDAVELLHAGARDYVLKDRLARLAPAVQRALSAEEGIRARKAAEEKIRKISESALDAIIMMGPDRCISFWNAAAERIFGYTAAEAMGQEVHTLLAPSQLHTTFAHGHTHFLETGEGPVIGKVLQMTALRKGGTEFPIELSISAAHLNGQWHAIGIARDISERKKAEEIIRKNEAYLIEAQRIGNVGSFDWDARTDTILWSDEYYHIYGIEPGQKPPGYEAHLKIYTPESAARLDAAVKKSMQTGESYVIDLEHLHPDGTRKWVTARGEVKHDEHNKIVGLRGTAQDITERKQAEKALFRLNRTLRALSTGNHVLVHCENEQMLLENMCHAVTEVGYVLAWVGYAIQDEQKNIVPMAVSGQGKTYVEALHITWDDQPLGRGPTGTAARTGQTQIANDIKNDPRMEPWREAATKYGYASSIALPLKENERVFGTLTIYAAEQGMFDPAQVSLLEEMASDLAFGVSALRIRHERDIAMEQNRQHIAQLQDSLEDTVRAIARIVEMRDPYTSGHQVRVANLAAAIAGQMGLPDEQVHAIHLAGVMHDLGKIQVPSEILSKPGRISDIERSLIMTHPQAGYDILKGIRFPWPIAQMVLQHHERLDGSGYPQGLKGDAILLEARILAVADVVEAMYSHRPYRPGLGLEIALAEITKQRGVYYDSQVTDACVALFREKKFSFG